MCDAVIVPGVIQILGQNSLIATVYNTERIACKPAYSAN